jgi:SAM-dependent methyltransferase
MGSLGGRPAPAARWLSMDTLAMGNSAHTETVQRSLLGHYTIPDKYFLLQFERLLEGRQVSGLTPRELFATLDDDFWVWSLTTGRRKSDMLAEFLPGLPSEEIQLKTNGISGDVALQDGYLMYLLFRKIYVAYRGELGPASGILDFGCGWGRITRFFLKDVEPDALWGVDGNDELIAICRGTSTWGNFKQIDVFPPTDFPSGTFDLVFSYSVFSHLSEDMHLQWLDEFARILKPGGLLIATTWDREVIERCGRLRDEQGVPFFKSSLAKTFHDTDAWLARYDRGEFCFDSSEEIYGSSSSWHGEACIPKHYVLSNWSPRLEVLDFIDDRSVAPQNVVVARR